MKNRILSRRRTCRLCENKNVEIVFSLKSTPPANAFRKKKEISKAQKKYPLNLMLCNNCGHAQLEEILDPKVLFENYVYVSGTSSTFIRHFERYAKHVISRFNLKPNSLIVEIGSNDGTLLSFLKGKKHRVIGVDPAKDIARRASQNGIRTIPSFFNGNISDQIIKEEGLADLILANNVYAHVDDLKKLTIAVKKLLNNNGVFIFEVSYLIDVYNKTLFDTIYHEHLSYHTIKPLVKFFKSLEMELFDVEKINTHGGSIRCYVQKSTGRKKIKISVHETLEIENKTRIFTPSTFHKLSSSIEELKNELNVLIRDIRKNGLRIAGFGAPAKATTLIHHFNITSKDIDFIVDDSCLKQGLFTPGHNIPVVSSNYLKKQHIDYLLILAWNFCDSIIANNKDFTKQGGKFIIPLPKLRVI